MKLNKDKTEVIVICRPRQHNICHSMQCDKLQDLTVKVGDAEVVRVPSDRNPGVMFDHWLPVREGLSFNILLLVFKARYDLGFKVLV